MHLSIGLLLGVFLIQRGDCGSVAVGREKEECLLSIKLMKACPPTASTL